MNPFRYRANLPLISAATLLLSAASSLAAPPTIAMYGDSTTAGYIGYGFTITPNNEPAYLAYSFWLAGYTAAVENHGIGAITCPQLRDGSGYVPRNWWQEMAASSAAIVTINLGMNDAGYRDAGRPIFTTCLGTLIDVARGYGKTVVLETPNPRLPGAVGDEGTMVATYATDMRAVAASKGLFIIDQWTYETLYYDWPSHVAPNGVHPDEAMYAYKATIAFDVLQPLVTALGR
jgi:lysophospholipase L1-like esterase